MPSSNLKMHTPNLVDSNIERLAALFPNCVTEKPKTDEQGKVIRDMNGEVVLERGIDFELLKQELSHSVIDGSQERYRLDWVGKREAIVTANSPIAKTLRPCRDESVDFETTGNLFIEGDNLEALKLLQESYLGKVKMIYIDPPYNTGNDFIYNDDFAADTAEFFERSGQVDADGNRLVANTESNGRFHSDWLSMMYSRLKLARNLLADDGVLFISIDEKEVFNLQKICDEVFGSVNHVENFHIQVRYANKSLNEDSDFQRVMEYVLIYCKDSNEFVPNKPHEPYDLSKFIFSIEEIGKGEEIFIGNKKVTVFKDKEWKIKKHSQARLGLLKETWASGSLINQSGSASEFLAKYLIDRKPLDGLGVLYKIDNMGEDGLGFRYVTGPQKEDAIRGKFYSGVPLERQEEMRLGVSKKYRPIVNFYDFSADFGNIRNEGGIAFNSGKKPVKLLMQLMDIANLDENSIILDFFAGSSTTAHAVMQANAIEQVNRKFIMVQINEQINKDKQKEAFNFCMENRLPTTIAEISKERIRRAGAKIKADNADKEGINELDTGFRVLKIDTTNMNDIYYRPQDYSQDLLHQLENNIKEDRSDEDLLFQFMLDTGVPLSLPIERTELSSKSGGHTIYQVGGNSLIASLDYIDANMVNDIAALNPLKFITSERAIATDSDKTNIKERFKQLSPHTDVRFI